MVKDGLFRRDLYYRLNVFPVSMPPLRERQGDIPLLVENFLEKYGHKIGKRGLRVAPEAEALLLAHSWPGNIRELENVIERAVILTTDGLILSLIHIFSCALNKNNHILNMVRI